MSIVDKAFLGSIMKAEYLLKDTVIQPEQLENTQLKELMRRLVELNRIGKNENVDLVTLTLTRPSFIRRIVLPFGAGIVCES